jgi:hypothetical protein
MRILPYFPPNLLRAARCAIGFAISESVSSSSSRTALSSFESNSQRSMPRKTKAIYPRQIQRMTKSPRYSCHSPKFGAVIFGGGAFFSSAFPDLADGGIAVLVLGRPLGGTIRGWTSGIPASSGTIGSSSISAPESPAGGLA